MNRGNHCSRKRRMDDKLRRVRCRLLSHFAARFRGQILRNGLVKGWCPGANAGGYRQDRREKFAWSQRMRANDLFPTQFSWRTVDRPQLDNPGACSETFRNNLTDTTQHRERIESWCVHGSKFVSICFFASWDTDKSARCHQPPPSAWNNAAVSA